MWNFMLLDEIQSIVKGFLQSHAPFSWLNFDETEKDSS